MNVYTYYVYKLCISSRLWGGPVAKLHLCFDGVLVAILEMLLYNNDGRVGGSGRSHIRVA
jgi:hypothetical protein